MADTCDYFNKRAGRKIGSLHYLAYKDVIDVIGNQGGYGKKKSTIYLPAIKSMISPSTVLISVAGRNF